MAGDSAEAQFGNCNKLATLGENRVVGNPTEACGSLGLFLKTLKNNE
jgi:hypothetical protein